MQNVIIKETVVNQELADYFSGKLKLMPGSSPKAWMNRNVVIALSQQEEILSIAFIKPFSEKKFKNTYGTFLPSGEYQFICDWILPRIKNDCVWIEVIESLTQGTGAGTKIVDFLKEKYPNIMLFSDVDADDYWVKQGFSTIAAGIYLWSKNKIF